LVIGGPASDFATTNMAAMSAMPTTRTTLLSDDAASRKLAALETEVLRDHHPLEERYAQARLKSGTGERSE
jgi:hypothetical protein